MTILELIKEEAVKYGKDISKEDAEYILWEHTGYPQFWNIPEDGATPQECLRKQVRVFLNKVKNNEKE